MRLHTSSGWAVAALILLGGLSRLAADDGALDPEFTKSLRDSVKMDGAMRALQNAVTGNDAKKLAVNRDILWEHNDIFNHKVKTKGITDQEISGRCWMFAGLNMLRPLVIEKYKLDDFEFSESYLAFWDKLEKANFFLETMIELERSQAVRSRTGLFLERADRRRRMVELRGCPGGQIRHHAQGRHAGDFSLGTYERDERGSGDEAARGRGTTAEDGGREETGSGVARGKAKDAGPRFIACWC